MRCILKNVFYNLNNKKNEANLVRRGRYSAGQRFLTNHGRFQPASPLETLSVTRALRSAVSAAAELARRSVVSSSQYTQCPQCKESDAARRGDVQPDWNDALSSPS